MKRAKRKKLGGSKLSLSEVALLFVRLPDALLQDLLESFDSPSMEGVCIGEHVAKIPAQLSDGQEACFLDGALLAFFRVHICCPFAAIVIGRFVEAALSE